jgi:DNA-binding transcriptional MocR family regulator
MAYMPDTTGAELPPRLSDQQQLALAAYTDAYDGTDRRPDQSALASVKRALRDEFYVSRQSITRTLRRLEDRGMIRRWGGNGRPVSADGEHGAGQTGQIWLTDDGERAADEILRRCRDGRYSLSFDAVDSRLR